MSTKRTTCLGTKGGRQCAAPSELIGPDGYCPSHGPNGSEEMARRGREGGRVTAERLAGKVGRVDLGLPDLQREGDAMEWLRIVGEAVASGVLSEKRGQVLVAAVREWRAAFESAFTIAVVRGVVAPLGSGDFAAAERAYREAVDDGLL